jgi:hypothetical protein
MWRPQTSVRLAVSNVLGHVVLLETLIETGMLTTAAILTGSEAARGVPKLRIKRPTFAEHSVDEFTTVIDGSFFAGRKVDSKLAYGQTKYLGAPWLSALARKHSTLRLVTVSPGNTSGTDGFRDFGLVTQHCCNTSSCPMLPRLWAWDTSSRTAPSAWWTLSSTTRSKRVGSTPAPRKLSPARSSTRPPHRRRLRRPDCPGPRLRRHPPIHPGICRGDTRLIVAVASTPFCRSRRASQH